MTSSNLSIIFGPGLMWTASNSLESAVDMPCVLGGLSMVFNASRAVYRERIVCGSGTQEDLLLPFLRTVKVTAL